MFVYSSLYLNTNTPNYSPTHLQCTQRWPIEYLSFWGVRNDWVHLQVCFAAIHPTPPHLQCWRAESVSVEFLTDITTAALHTGVGGRGWEWGEEGTEGREDWGERLRADQCLRKYMVCEGFRFLFYVLVPRTHEFSLFCSAALHGLCFYHFKTILNLSFSDQACVHAYVGAFRTSSFWTHLVSGVFEAYPVRGHFGSILYIITLGLS